MDFLTESSYLQLDYYLSRMSGDIGVCCNQAVPKSLLYKSPIKSFYYYQNQSIKQELSNIFVQGEHTEIPFLTDSIDAFVLWHNLDFHSNPRLFLNEIWRALAPEGIILMLGANNPCLFKQTSKKVKLNSRVYLLRLLIQQGFQIEVQKTFGFRPRLANQLVYNWLKPLEVIGQFCWPLLGTRYLIFARKPILGGTALRVEKTVPIKNLPGIAEPSTFKYYTNISSKMNFRHYTSEKN